MANVNELAEQHIRKHESLLKHMDELFEQAEAGEESTELRSELAQLRQEREKLLAHIEELKSKVREEWQEESFEEAGPMIVWEAVAKRLEKLVQRVVG